MLVLTPGVLLRVRWRLEHRWRCCYREAVDRRARDADQRDRRRRQDGHPRLRRQGRRHRIGKTDNSKT